MATLTELCHSHTKLDSDQVSHLQNLTAIWGLLADLSFADLLLYGMDSSHSENTLVLLGHIRPTTGTTIYRADMIGQTFESRQRPLITDCFNEEKDIDGLIQAGPDRENSVRAIPVRLGDQVIAVLARERVHSTDKASSVLERTYRRVFHRFVEMIERGEFPYREEERLRHRTPRVGDGLLLVDDQGLIEFASPNAVSALHRLGMHRAAVGSRLEETNLGSAMLRQAFARRTAVIEEATHGTEVVVVSHCLPMLDKRSATGAIVLLRDVTDLRRRDRELVSKDTTIREVHHRVKNNLQTISSLLRLQSRRLKTDEARAAVEESVRRISAISVVHETLAQSAEDDAEFTEIVRLLVRLVEETVSLPERPLRFSVEGEGGTLPSQVTTTLAVVVTELLQNAVDHGYAQPNLSSKEASGNVIIQIDRRPEGLNIQVIDDGIGLPEGFEIEKAQGLGLTIVRTFIEGELGGSLTLKPVNKASGAIAEVQVPASRLLGPWDDAQEPEV